MSLSFAAEPRRKGLFAPYYWSRQTNHGQQVLIPLLFPEVLPTVTYIDRSQLVRTKKISFETGAVLGDGLGVRLLDVKRTGALEPNGLIRMDGVGRSRNKFDLGGMILPVFEGELLLCVI